MRIGIIGGGAMGEAITAALLKDGIVSGNDITIAEMIPARREALENRYGVRTSSVSRDAAAADYVLLALKPQDFDKAGPGLAGAFSAGATTVSIMAGVPIAKIASLTGNPSVVRAMPNTPAQIGAGMTVWTATDNVSPAARDDVKRIFQALGREAFVPEERYLDMATAVSGSGPGYVFLFIEALIDAAVHVGLSRDLATTMAIQTVGGAARYAEQTGRHPAELRNAVTSPGGTTAEGLRVLEVAGLRAAVTDAVIAAYTKSKALGEAEAK